MNRVLVAALSLALLLGATACGGGSEVERSAPASEPSPEAIPWSEVVELASAQRGEYEKVIAAPQDGSVATLLTEWVTFDLRERFIDRRVGLGAGIQQGAEATKEQPTLRFLYTRDGFLMWNPGVEQACGTPWVDMPPQAIAAATGISVNPRDVFVIEPFDAIAAADPPAQVKSVTREATVYEIWVPGMTGIPTSSALANKPGLIRELQDQQLSAEVRVPPEGGPWEMEVDLTPAFEIIQPGAVSGAEPPTTTWTITAPKHVPEPELPSEVADFSCMN